MKCPDIFLPLQTFYYPLTFCPKVFQVGLPSITSSPRSSYERPLQERSMMLQLHTATTLDAQVFSCVFITTSGGCHFASLKMEMAQEGGVCCFSPLSLESHSSVSSALKIPQVFHKSKSWPTSQPVPNLTSPSSSTGIPFHPDHHPGFLFVVSWS